MKLATAFGALLILAVAVTSVVVPYLPDFSVVFSDNDTSSHDPVYAGKTAQPPFNETLAQRPRPLSSDGPMDEPLHTASLPTAAPATSPLTPVLPQASVPSLPAVRAPVATALPLPPVRPTDLDKSLPHMTPLPSHEAAGNGAKGSPVFVRIFKEEGELELWVKRGGQYTLAKTYEICKWSGTLGPKEKEGDYQSPEGFYSVSAKQLNPNSAYFRAFNVGYPNAYDRQHGRTGSALMVHGKCASVGCFAMTDKNIAEIYGYVEAAINHGQGDVPVHIFPFRFSAINSLRIPLSPWSSFWQNLKEGYDRFEKSKEPPVAFACNRKYVFGGSGQSSAACARIAGW